MCIRDSDRAFLRVINPVDDVQHRAFARAVRADDGADFVLANVEGNVSQRLDAAEAQGNVLKVENDLADGSTHRSAPRETPVFTLGRDSVPSEGRSRRRGLLLLNVLTKDGNGRTATGGGKVTG